MIHVVFGQFSCTNGLRMLQNPGNASSLAPIDLVVLPRVYGTLSSSIEVQKFKLTYFRWF